MRIVVLDFSRAKPVMVKKYPYGKGGPIRGTLMAGSLPTNIAEHNKVRTCVFGRPCHVSKGSYF
jgi:hypothetical protein